MTDIYQYKNMDAFLKIHKVFCDINLKILMLAGSTEKYSIELSHIRYLWIEVNNKISEYYLCKNEEDEMKFYFKLAGEISGVLNNLRGKDENFPIPIKLKKTATFEFLEMFVRDMYEQCHAAATSIQYKDIEF